MSYHKPAHKKQPDHNSRSSASELLQVRSSSCMKLSAASIREFCRLYKDHFGVELTDREASEKAGSLLRLVRAIYQPQLGNKHQQR